MTKSQYISLDSQDHVNNIGMALFSYVCYENGIPREKHHDFLQLVEKQLEPELSKLSFYDGFVYLQKMIPKLKFEIDTNKVLDGKE